MPRALEGIRVVDFSWVLAGPTLTRCLGDFGAEVIKVETNLHPDVIRTSPPYKGGKQTINNSGYWATYNCNKYSLAVDLNNRKGIDVVKRLIAKSDVVVENFIPGTMEKWGLGYNDLLKVKPDIIMVSISLYGQDGPFKRRFGFGAFAEGMCGIFNLIGWPDRAPSNFQLVIGDAIVPFFGVITLMAALEHRNRTGEGQWIDVNQLDVCAYLMTPNLLDYSINNREAIRCGNASPGYCPHGVYPCAGREKWCAIAVTTDEEWYQFCEVMEKKQLINDPRFSTFSNRKANERELDEIISSWTKQFSPFQIMTMLQEKGIPAGVVWSGEGFTEDPQLKHRGSLWRINHPEIGDFGYLTMPFKLSATPAEPRLPPPCLGEHTEYVCSEIIGMPIEEFVQLLNENVFT